MKFDEETVNKMFKDVDMHFSWYYKYEFSFRGGTEDYVIFTSYGGDSADIYRYDVEVNKPKKFDACYDWSYVSVIEKKTDEEVFEYDKSW